MQNTNINTDQETKAMFLPYFHQIKSIVSSTLSFPSSTCPFFSKPVVPGQCERGTIHRASSIATIRFLPKNWGWWIIQWTWLLSCFIGFIPWLSCTSTDRNAKNEKDKYSSQIFGGQVVSKRKRDSLLHFQWFLNRSAIHHILNMQISEY